MPFRLTILELRTLCFQRADMENDLSIGTTEANNNISEQYGSLYGLVASTGLRYFETSVDVTMTGLAYIAEPTDHLATVDNIERVMDAAGHLRRLRQLQPQERAMWAGRTGHARRWELVDDRINLYPTPPAGDIYRLRYVPQPPRLGAYLDTDTVDVVSPNGLEFMVWGTAVKLLAKSKSDVTLALSERDRAGANVVEWAQLRAFNDGPRTIVDDPDDGPFCDGEYWYDR